MNSKRKGTQGEHELLRILKANGIEAHRNEQMFIGGLENPDVAAKIASEPIHFEVKRRERLSIYEAMHQAEHDSNGKAVPVVAYRKNREKWLVILSLEDFLQLTKAN